MSFKPLPFNDQSMRSGSPKSYIHAPLRLDIHVTIEPFNHGEDILPKSFVILGPSSEPLMFYVSYYCSGQQKKKKDRNK